MPIVILALALVLASTVLAYRAWQLRSRLRLVAAILIWFASALAWAHGFGAEVGVPLAIETGALVTFAFILTRMQRREARPEQAHNIAPSADRSPRRRWRSAARTLVAGPLGLASAMGVAIAIAVAAPMLEQTRLILAGLIVPSLWGGFIVWTLASERMLRPALALVVIGGVGFGIALVPGA